MKKQLSIITVKGLVFLSILSLSSCKKQKLIDAVGLGSKLTKADAGKQLINPLMEGTYYCISHDITDSLVVKFKYQLNDSLYYESNIIYFNSCLKHGSDYKKDDNLILNKFNQIYEFRPAH